ncbi:type VI secretion system contractile sheath small subunit, partial [Acinetobacter baumannii]|uniref:type VI secretion system contractile sheath small subunit n=1 Tax=Acinetobacter baumannii TaxID=470 RepID=UPI000810996C
IVGAMGDFSAASELDPKTLKDQKFIRDVLDNIDDVMESLSPRDAFQVDNTLTEAGGKMAVDLTFTSMEDFRPENVVQQVDPLKQLVEARERLTDLRKKI